MKTNPIKTTLSSNYKFTLNVIKACRLIFARSKEICYIPLALYALVQMLAKMSYF